MAEGRLAVLAGSRVVILERQGGRPLQSLELPEPGTALALAAHPNLSVDELRSLLFRSVDRLPSLQGRVITAGRINATRAVGH